MYLYNEFIMNILNDINTLSCPSKNNSNTIELTHTSLQINLNLWFKELKISILQGDEKK